MRERLPGFRPGKTLHFVIYPEGDQVAEHGLEVDGYVTTGLYEDGRLGEVFVRVGKPGNGSAAFDQWAIAFSVALQSGADFGGLCRKFVHQQFAPCGPTGVPGIPRCSSVVDLVCRWLLQKYGEISAQIDVEQAQRRRAVLVQIPTHVVGFCFSRDLARVVLIRKARPAWQAGKLNGVGGKIEAREMPEQAMAREFREETGYAGEVAWRHFCHYACPTHGTVLAFFAAWDDAAFEGAAGQDPTEPIERASVEEIVAGGVEAIPNLLWLVPMARNLLCGLSADTFNVGERDGA